MHQAQKPRYLYLERGASLFSVLWDAFDLFSSLCALLCIRDGLLGSGMLHQMAV
jgi:hypothetical protein